jgi:hypothetical protein
MKPYNDWRILVCKNTTQVQSVTGLRLSLLSWRLVTALIEVRLNYAACSRIWLST